MTSKFVGTFLIILCGFLSAVHAAPGDLDTTFAGTGFTKESSSFGSADWIFATAIQPDGKIVAIGRIEYGDIISCGITRYNADGSLDTSFDTDGKMIVPIGIEFNCTDIAVQTDGKIVVVGFVRVDSTYNFALFRFNSDGSPDVSFDGDGKKINVFVNFEQAQGIAIQADGKLVVCGNIGDDFAVVRYNPDGSFDTSFDGDGWTTTDFNGGPDHSRAIAIQPDGKILIAGNGRAAGSTNNDFGIVRYNADGSLDTSFDGDGKVLTNFYGYHDNVQEIALQADGKIVVGGQCWSDNHEFGLARYNTDGSLDTSFDGDGKVASSIADGYDILNDLVIQPDGKIVAIGVAYVFSSGNNFEIVRYNPNGSLDTSFDGDGSSIFRIASGESVAFSASVQPDGKIIVAGYTQLSSFSPSSADFALARLNSNGSLDTSFDADGKVTTDVRSRRIYANAVAVQPDGKIVAVGIEGNDFAVYRYNPNGTRDITFDGDGKAVTDIFSVEAAYAVAFQPDGKIVVAGYSSQDAAIVRYNSNGSLDTSFDGDGIMIEDSDAGGPEGSCTISTVLIQPDGKILAGGWCYNTFAVGIDFTIYRYNANGSRDNSFDGDGKVQTDFSTAYNLRDEIRGMAIQPDGKIVAAGVAEFIQNKDFALARYNADGSLDTSFDGDGKVSTNFTDQNDYVDDVALQADGKIVVAGQSSNDTALARYNANGSLDTSFDGDGRVRIPVSSLFDAATGVAIQTDGKIVTSGYATSISNNDFTTLNKDFALLRFNSNGSLDGTFGSGGKAMIDLSRSDIANDIALDSSGRFLIAGETDGYLTVARILNGAAAPGLLTPFDFDGDDKSDISIFRPSNGEWWYQRSSDNQVSALQFGNSADRITPADFTGDGKTDVAVWRPSTGEWFVLRSEDLSYYSAPFGTTGDLPAPADFDGDGKADLAVFRPSVGTWFISKSTGGTDIVSFGQNGDVPTPADYDGDGRADIAIFRPSNGQWWLNRSTAGVFAATFGASTDKPVAGEYTSDGRADIAFFRPSSGEWFVLRSENLSYYSVPFGANGDTPTPGDYDGDGKFDTAVFRSSNLTWYINRTTSGLLIQQFGSTGDKPVPSAFVP